MSSAICTACGRQHFKRIADRRGSANRSDPGHLPRFCFVPRKGTKHGRPSTCPRRCYRTDTEQTQADDTVINTYSAGFCRLCLLGSVGRVVFYVIFRPGGYAAAAGVPAAGGAPCGAAVSAGVCHCSGAAPSAPSAARGGTADADRCGAAGAGVGADAFGLAAVRSSSCCRCIYAACKACSFRWRCSPAARFFRILCMRPLCSAVFSVRCSRPGWRIIIRRSLFRHCRPLYCTVC